MSRSYDDFILGNTLKVNRTVQFILLGTIFLPAVFCIGTITKLWEIPFDYCLTMLIYTIFASIISMCLNRSEKWANFSMYFGVIAVSIFVGILAYKGVIRLSISYALGTIISCMYYNRRLTITTGLVNYLLSISITYVQSGGKDVVKFGFYTRIQYVIQMVIGLTIEFTFLMILAATMAKLSQRTMSKLMQSLEERDDAFEKLNEQNKVIRSINTNLENKNQELNDTQYKIIQFVAKCLGSHDLFTGRHVVHTQKYVEIICKQLISDGYYVEELTEKSMRDFVTAAFLHDIGKIHIPEGVLNKTGKFTPEEFDMMKCHPEEGKKLLEYLPPVEEGNFNKVAIRMAYCHHEKWDGSGYPRGIAGKEIPLEARIMAAADVLDALVSQRLYKEPMSVEEAMKVFRKSSGSHFEPCIAEAVIKNQSLIELIDKDFKTNEAATNAEELEWWQRYHSTFNKV